MRFRQYQDSDAEFGTPDTGLRNTALSAALAGGGFALAWTNEVSLDGTAFPDVIRVRVFDSNGNGGTVVQVNSALSGEQSGLALIALAGGGFVIAWTEASGVAGSGTDIHALLFDHFGQPIGNELTLNADTAGDQREVGLIPLPDGGFAATWLDVPSAQRQGMTFDATGVPTGTDIPFTGRIQLTNGEEIEVFTVLTAENATGGPTAPNDDEFDVLAQFYSSAGVATGDPILLDHRFGEFTVTTLALPQGGFALGFSHYSYGGAVSSSGRFVFRTYDETGSPQGNERFVFFAEVAFFKPQTNFIVDESGRLVVTWATDVGIQTQIFAPDFIPGTPGNDSLRGSSVSDTIDGGAGNDTIVALAGDDTLIGGTGNDLLKGLGGDDRLTGGAGSDTLVSGDGADSFVLGLPGAPGERDRILGFSASDDFILLDRAIFTAFSGNVGDAIGAEQFVIGRNAVTADQHLIFDLRNARLYYDIDGAGGSAQVEIATIFGMPALDISNFALIG